MTENGFQPTGLEHKLWSIEAAMMLRIFIFPQRWVRLVHATLHSWKGVVFFKSKVHPVIASWLL